MPNWLKDRIKNVSTDCVIFGFEDSSIGVLAYKRAQNPSKGAWALPGGFLIKGELIEEAARRILKDTTGVANIYLEEVGVFDQIDRFPSWRVFTIGYFALVSPKRYKLISSGTYTLEAKWFKIDELPPLAWDHQNIVDKALEKLRARVLTKPIGFELLPEKFTLPQLQTLYEVILDKSFDKRNFRKKILNMDILTKLDEKDRRGKKRPADLYKFNKQNYHKLVEQGMIFGI
ncbi:MAG: NUDIX domain-containing protein [Calditrichaceae bacterium]|jgi:8-oxo-dGTP diphosphatase